MAALLLAGCNGQSKTGSSQPLVKTGPIPGTSTGASAGPSLASPEPTHSPAARFVPDRDALAARASHPNFGYLSVRRESVPIQLSYDKALFLGGNEANKAASEHGDETPVPNDYYIVNDNKRLRTVTLAKAVRVIGSTYLNDYAHHPDVAPQPRTVHELLGFLRTSQAKEAGFNLRFDSAGLVVSIEEQYQP